MTNSDHPSDHPDDVFTTLRMPGSHAELSDESRVVDLMVNAHPTSTGDPMTTSARFTSRRARVGAMIAAGVIGFGGVAAAGPGGLDPLDLGPDTDAVVEDTVPDETIPEATVPEETVPDETVPDETVPDETVPDETVPDETVPADTVVDETATERSTAVDADIDLAEEPEPPLLVDNVDTDFDESTCLEGNHGTTVSAVARGDAPFEDVEVRDAAQSDCGKKDPVEDDEADVEEAGDDTEDEKKNNGNGNGKGKGKPGDSGRAGGPGNSGGKGKNGK